jgi:hypothetical protein
MRTCGRCGRAFEELEARIDGVDFCHPSMSTDETCYQIAARELVGLKWSDHFVEIAMRRPDRYKRQARIRCTPELLRELLHLPEGTQITGASGEMGYGGVTIDFIVQHPDLPESPSPRLAEPSWTRAGLYGPPIFQGWGLR